MSLKKPKLQQPKYYTTRDDFRTPYYATEILIPYIPKCSFVWECASGEGHITRVLLNHGFRVFESDILHHENKIDFIKETVDFEIKDFVIITNPPYSLKKEFIYKALDYNVPFAFLISADYSQWLIDVLEKDGVKRITPKKRINFITPHRKLGTTSYFHSYWLTRYFNLPEDRQEIFVDINPKGRIE